MKRKKTDRRTMILIAVLGILFFIIMCLFIYRITDLIRMDSI